MERIEFKKQGYDPQVDYIKGLCILFVIWTHCINRDELGHIYYPFWGDTAVPIFLIIQVFHYYKKESNIRMPSMCKLWNRILLPFLIMTAVLFATQYFIYYDDTDGSFSPSFYWDKRGPGSYYIFIYMEMTFVIPLFAPLFKRLSAKWLFLIFVALSQLIEFVTCITHCPDAIYRIAFFRYTFLIFLGFLLATRGLELNMLTLAGGVISILFIYLFNYTTIDMEPIFCTSLDHWPLCHWICYIYIAYFFLWFIKHTYTSFHMPERFLSYIEKIGKYSYEIYLFQIFYYATISLFIGDILSFANSYPIQRILFILLSTVICVAPVVYLKNRKKS